MSREQKIEEIKKGVLSLGFIWNGVQDSLLGGMPEASVINRATGRTVRCIFDWSAQWQNVVTAVVRKVDEDSQQKQEKKMTENVKLNLRQKLVQVYSRIDHIEKAGYNEKQRYAFVRSADVLHPVRKAFLELGIWAEPNYELLGTYDIKTNSGGNMHAATVKATIKLYDADSDETKTISGLGDGADGGDKGILKAQTAATKNALRNGALIPDEADPEADTQVDEAVDNTQGQPFEEPPDYRDASHAAPRANEPKNNREENYPSPGTAVEQPPIRDTHECIDGDHQKCTDAQTRAIAPDSEPQVLETREQADGNDRLPTAEEMDQYRSKFHTLAIELAEKGKLKNSPKLPASRKILVFLQKITGVDKVPDIKKHQWEDFFVRAEHVKTLEEGFVGLAKLVNKANGIEDEGKKNK